MGLLRESVPFAREVEDSAGCQTDCAGGKRGEVKEEERRRKREEEKEEGFCRISSRLREGKEEESGGGERAKGGRIL